jgi:putative Holliday junction resolvase
VRAVGLDLGSKRIGVSLSNSEGTVATPYEVVERSGDRQRDHRAIRDLVIEAEAEIVVVGLPLSLDGSQGPMAKKYTAEAAEIEGVVGVPVTMWDERFSTVTAEQALIRQNLDAKKRRKIIDKVAATVMLQAWLDATVQPPETT